MSDLPADKENLTPASVLTPSKAFSYDLNSVLVDRSRQTYALDCTLGLSPTSKCSSASIFTELEASPSEEVASLTNSMIRTEVNAILAQLGLMKQQLTTEALIKDALQADLAKSKALYSALSNEKAELEQRLEGLNSKTLHATAGRTDCTDTEQEVASLEQTRDNLKASLLKIKEDYACQVSELSVLQNRYDNLLDENKRLKAEAKQLTEILANAEDNAEEVEGSQTAELAKLSSLNSSLVKENEDFKESLEDKTEAYAREVQVMRRRYEEDLKLQMEEWTYRQQQAAIDFEYQKKKALSEKLLANQLLCSAQAAKEETATAGSFLATQAARLAEEKERVLDTTAAERTQRSRLSLLAFFACFIGGVLCCYLGARGLSSLRIV
jgi:chromosome segregation ATPase